MWKLKNIVSHEETLIASHAHYNLYWYNIMFGWEIGDTTTEPFYIISLYDPFMFTLYEDYNHFMLTVPSFLIIIYISVTLNYPLMKYGKALIYEYFHHYKHQGVGNLSYDIITLEHTDTHIHIYNNGTNYIMYLLHLESRKHYGQ